LSNLFDAYGERTLEPEYQIFDRQRASKEDCCEG
jgi:hypothetical protein